MAKTLKPLAIFLGLLLSLATCSGSPGRRAYLDSGCPRCHGTDRSGSATGPSLKDLKYIWTKEDLVRFLKGPAEFTASDPRLKALSERYGTKMPAFAMDEETRKALAEYLLKE